MVRYIQCLIHAVFNNTNFDVYNFHSAISWLYRLAITFIKQALSLGHQLVVSQGHQLGRVRRRPSQHGRGRGWGQSMVDQAWPRQRPGAKQGRPTKYQEL